MVIELFLITLVIELSLVILLLMCSIFYNAINLSREINELLKNNS